MIDPEAVTEIANALIKKDERIKELEAKLANSRHDYETADKNYLDLLAKYEASEASCGMMREALEKHDETVAQGGGYCGHKPKYNDRQLFDIRKSVLSSTPPSAVWEAIKKGREALQYWVDRHPESDIGRESLAVLDSLIEGNSRLLIAICRCGHHETEHYLPVDGLTRPCKIDTCKQKCEDFKENK